MEHALHVIESLRLERGAALAFAVALGLALLARWRGLVLPIGMMGGIGILAGWWVVFGVLTGSPRQVPERLPLLVLALLLFAAAGTALARRWPWAALPSVAIGAAFAGWWMAGAPRTPPDLLRAWPAFAGVALATFALTLAATPRWAGPVAAAALLGGLLAVPLAGPAAILGAVLLAGTLGAALVPQARDLPRPGLVPVAGALAALAALPIMLRGGLADWAVAGAPFAALLLGAPIAARLAGPRAALPGAILFGIACAIFAFMMR